ncbi:MAG: hypothetical protein J2P48_02230 [Alphaproteobacteria bacterium]|nr:hypothetical protein [Alphaproteobacteria bacterium]
MPGIVTLLAPTLWVGILSGVSYIATPLKFRAASLTRAAALEVGRVTFQFFQGLNGP